MVGSVDNEIFGHDLTMFIFLLLLRELLGHLQQQISRLNINCVSQHALAVTSEGDGKKP
jgi:hypothetical protein